MNGTVKGRPDTSDDAVTEATGRNWAAWRKLLDEAGAKDWPHRRIVAWLAENSEISSWWRQQVTVGYEKMAGLRVVGQTADAGFHVGVRKTYPLSAQAIWKELVKPEAMKLWLGTGAVKLEAGEVYEASGVLGEIRVVKPADRIRFTRAGPGGKPPSTVQIALMASGPEKTSITFHHEKLSGAEERSAMRDHWRAVAGELEKIFAKG